MRVFIVGANGQVGQHVVNKLKESEDHTPIAMVRKEEQLEGLKERNIEAQLVDLEGSIGDIQTAIEESNADAVVFAAGSGGSTGADKTMIIDLDGAVKSMKAAKQANVKRFVIVSAIGTHKYHEFDEKNSGGAPSYYTAAKYYADQWLVNSGLDYTIIRPGLLTNDSGTGQIQTAESLEAAEIPREDVASTIIASLENDQTIGKGFDVVGGEKAIEEEIRKL